MSRPLFIYALPSDTKVKDATINLLTFENWNLQFQSLGIFEQQESINRKTLSRLTDVCDKAFSSLEENRDRIAEHIRRLLKVATTTIRE